MKIDLATLERFFAMAPHMVDLGIRPSDTAEGRVTTRLEVQRKHLQHSGVVHAGVMASMADHTMGAAAQTMAREDQLVMTAELKTSMLRAAKAAAGSGDVVVCEARVLKPGRSLSFTEAEVYVESGGERTLVVKASATMALTAMPAGLASQV
jgi:uncharacterized protein (TIGR00369 family)